MGRLQNAPQRRCVLARSQPRQPPYTPPQPLPAQLLLLTKPWSRQQHAHINDLVQKNRSAEQTVRKLKEDLSKAAADILALNDERKSWEGDRKAWTIERHKLMDERKTWAEGCDTMQACHRIQQCRVACALDDERVAVLKMQEVARREQLKRLQRDYKITKFQAREAELEAQLEEAEELKEEAMEVRDQHEKSAQELKVQCAGLVDEIKSKTAEIKAAQKQREQIEDDLRRLREAHADVTAASTTASSKLARITTERDALEPQIASLKNSLELAQDEAIELRTQLANWKILKKGEHAEAEAKQKDRVGKLKQFLEEWKAEAEQQTTARKTVETQLADAQVQIASLEQKIVELQAELSAACKAKPVSKKAPPPEPAKSDNEIGAALTSPSTSLPTKVKKPSKPESAKPASSKPSSTRPADAPAKPRPKPRIVKKPDPIPELQESDIEIIEPPPAPSPAPEPSAKAKGKQKAVHDDDAGSDAETGEVRKDKKKGKTKETEKEIELKEPTKAKVTKPKKTSTNDDTDETRPKAKAKARKRPSPDTPPKKSKAKPSQLREDSDDAAAGETDAPPKKKKRKINILNTTSQPATFNWDNLGQNWEEGLGIPTQLSPMKDTDVVPRRFISPALPRMQLGPDKNSQNPVMVQFFTWDAQHPDMSWWKHFENELPRLAELGFTQVWLPPPNKAMHGKRGQGYDAYDLWDLGEFDQKGTIATRWGTRQELLDACSSARRNNISVIIDAVLNHKIGADRMETFNAVSVDPENRLHVLERERKVRGWTAFDFPGRQGKYSSMKWTYEHFTGLDWDDLTQSRGVYRISSPNHKGWSRRVDSELGNYDYLLGVDIDYRHPAVRDDIHAWGSWILDETGGGGFRLDAIKHIDRHFLFEFIQKIRRVHDREKLFFVSEYWSANLRKMLPYIRAFQGYTAFFDVPLHDNFHQASKSGSSYDLRHILDNTLLTLRPKDAVTFVDNHDTQIGQSLESWVDTNFKVQAYALILLRSEGYPCVFYGDLYPNQECFAEATADKIRQLLTIRKMFANGPSKDYPQHRNCIGFVRLGNPGCAVVLSNESLDDRTRTTSPIVRMHVGQGGKGAVFRGVFNPTRCVVVDRKGWGEFYCSAGAVEKGGFLLLEGATTLAVIFK
ncbi:glycoside hydrolase superfamily [Chiua virens]|nr:glycoside hydrolase superfamily [Chiua virens]